MKACWSQERFTEIINFLAPGASEYETRLRADFKRDLRNQDRKTLDRAIHLYKRWLVFAAATVGALEPELLAQDWALERFCTRVYNEVLLYVNTGRSTMPFRPTDRQLMELLESLGPERLHEKLLRRLQPASHHKGAR